MEFMKGFRTVMLGVVATITGGAIAGGFVSPDVGAEVTASVTNAFNAYEKGVGAFIGLWGVLVMAARAVTDSPIFKKR